MISVPFDVRSGVRKKNYIFLHNNIVLKKNCFSMYFLFTLAGLQFHTLSVICFLPVLRMVFWRMKAQYLLVLWKFDLELKNVKDQNDLKTIHILCRFIFVFHGQSDKVWFFTIFVSDTDCVVSSILIAQMSDCQSTISPISTSFQKWL